MVDGVTVTAQGAQLRGDSISLALTQEIAGRSVRHEFSGQIQGDRITGRVTIAGEPATLDWQATRIARGVINTE